MSSLQPLNASLERVENREVLRFLNGKSAHGDLVEALLQATESLGDVQAFCPEPESYAYLLMATQGVAFAFAIGQATVAFRLDTSFKGRALESGGNSVAELGAEWASFENFRPNYPAVDLQFWARKAYTIARGEDPS